MKRLSLVLAIAALALPQAGQAGWWRTYGPGGDGYCVQTTSDGNYIVCGAKDYDVWLLKIDTLGNLIWQKTYAGGDGLWVEETSDRCYIIAKAYGIMKTDSAGDSLWVQDYGIYPKCIQETPDNGYIVTGISYDDKLALVRTNPQGDTLWTRYYDEPGNNRNRGYFVQNTKDGGFIMTGYTSFYDEVSGNVLWSDVWFLKTNGAGNKQWSHIYNPVGGISEGNCVRQTADGGYVIVGDKNGELWILLTDSKGDTIRTRTYNSGSGGIGLNVSITSDSGYIITGATTSALLASSSPELYDLWLLKVNSQGDTLWTRTYGGNNSEAGRSVQQTSDGGYIVTGYASSFGPNSLYLIKTDSLGFLAVAEKPKLETLNNWELVTPIGKEIAIRYWDKPQGFHASIFDVSGRKVDVLNSSNQSGIISWGSGCLPGVYFMTIKNKTKVATLKVVIVR